MKIHFIEKIILIFFLSIGNGNVFASDHGRDAITDINWWSLGSEYCLRPALGWSYFTFVLFVLFTVYYSNKTLRVLLNERSLRIKSEIERMCNLKIAASRDLNFINSQLKSLDSAIKKITLNFDNKNKIEKNALDLETSLIIE